MPTTPENWQQVLADAADCIAEAKNTRRFTPVGRQNYQSRPMILGVPVIKDQTGALPLTLSPEDEGRRIVRHGLARVLRWLGEDVGPSPDDRVHVRYDETEKALVFSQAAFDSVYQNMWNKLSIGW